jgi:hypothetical protein
MGKVIQIEVPDWMDEKLARKVIDVFVELQESRRKKIIEEIERILSKSKLTEEKAKKLEEIIKDGLWKEISSSL